MHHYFLITPPAISRDQWFDLKKLSVAIRSFVHLPGIPDTNFGILFPRRKYWRSHPEPVWISGINIDDELIWVPGGS